MGLVSIKQETIPTNDIIKSISKAAKYILVAGRNQEEFL